MKPKHFIVFLLICCLFSGLKSNAQDSKATPGNEAIVKTTDQEKQELKDIIVKIGVLQTQLQAEGLKLENARLKLQLKYNCKECDLTQELNLIPKQADPKKP